MRALLPVFFLSASLGCTRMPNPGAPALSGSLGMPHLGSLTEPAALALEGEGYRMLRDNDRRYGLPRFVEALARASRAVHGARGGAPLLVGDLSAPSGGAILPHFSHRNGRDVDLLFYVTTLEGASVPSPGFVHFGADGLGWDEVHGRYLRLDLEREWLLVRALLLDEDARVQWIFVSRVVTAMLLEWARARGEPSLVLERAQEVMAQPQPGGVHDDHLHVRTACAHEDVLRGCEPTGTQRAWHKSPRAAGEPVVDGELVLELLRPVVAPDTPHLPGLRDEPRPSPPESMPVAALE